uniref:8.9 kDa family member n=1 Tax=Rhipicephalus appendiculatus TaxID=34631 RepID=A0A131YQQ9_RHIAP
MEASSNRNMKKGIFLLTVLGLMLTCPMIAAQININLTFDDKGNCIFNSLEVREGRMVSVSPSCVAFVCKASELRMELLGCPEPIGSAYTPSHPKGWPDCCDDWV